MNLKYTVWAWLYPCKSPLAIILSHGLGSRVGACLGSRVQGLGLRALGFRVERFRVQGCRFLALGPPQSSEISSCTTFILSATNPRLKQLGNYETSTIEAFGYL